MCLSSWNFNETHVQASFFFFFFWLKPNNQTHTDSQLTEADWGAGAGGCIGAWGPGGFVCGLFAGVGGCWGGWEVYPQRSPWHQPVPEEKNQPLFLDGCCHFGDVAGQICERNRQQRGFMRRDCWSVDTFSHQNIDTTVIHVELLVSCNASP